MHQNIVSFLCELCVKIDWRTVYKGKPISQGKKSFGSLVVSISARRWINGWNWRIKKMKCSLCSCVYWTILIARHSYTRKLSKRCHLKKNILCVGQNQSSQKWKNNQFYQIMYTFQCKWTLGRQFTWSPLIIIQA